MGNPCANKHIVLEKVKPSYFGKKVPFYNVNSKSRLIIKIVFLSDSTDSFCL